MDIHSKTRGSEGMTEKKKFSLRNLGITSYHTAPAVLMIVAGLALSAIISDVPPSFNQVFASQNEIIVDGENQTTMPEATLPVEEAEGESVNKQTDVKVSVDDVNSNLVASEIASLTSKENNTVTDFSVYVSTVTDSYAKQKLREIEIAERQRELREASGQVVASSNRKLYLDTYKYQRGPSNIPSTGLYTSCVPGQVISQMVPPSTLTFDENGVPEDYLYKIEGKSTAYYGGYMTATGSAVRPGVAAVDPREIPYGTEMWIVSSDGKYVYGFARAEDTGGFIEWPKGATVDLYMNTYSDCCVWGWRGVTIYVLPTSYK